MLNDIFRKSQSKHVSFDGSNNLNNNNSSTYQQYSQDITHQNSRQKNYRKKETYSTSNDYQNCKFTKEDSFFCIEMNSIYFS